MYLRRQIQDLRQIAVACLGFLIMAGASDAVFAQSLIPQRNAVPVVKPVEVERGSGEYRISTDEPIGLPNHPPLDQIPPMPFPGDSPGDGQLRPVPESGSGGVVEYDLASGTVRRNPEIQLPADMKFLSGREFSGADGGGSSESDGIDQRINGSMTVVANTAINPWRRIVKLVVRFQNAMGQNEFAECSGTMIDAETVLTAGNCLYEFGGRGWAKEVWVYPGWDGVGGLLPEIVNPYGYGTASATNLYTTEDWVDSGDPDQDLGAIVINRAVGMLTGWFGYSAAGNCNFHLAQLYHNASYPAATCSFQLHTGTTMYYWNGAINNCVGNLFRLETSAGCTNAIWGGQNGGGLYYVDGGGARVISAVTSSSDQATEAFFTRLDQAWVDFTDDTIIPAARGSNFDLQALQLDATPGNVEQGDDVTITSHLATNPTNGTANKAFTFGVYLSTNSSITPSDTLLAEFTYNHSFAAMSSASIGPFVVTIPASTPPGDYYLGVRYDNQTDGNFSNNATNAWDAFPLHVSVLQPPPPPPPPCNCPLDCLLRASINIPEGLRNLLPAGMNPLAFVHQYRDDVMAQSPLGRRYVSLYYEHAPELSRLITQHPRIGQSSIKMLGRITPHLVRIMEGSSAELTDNDRAAAFELIELVDGAASPELQVALTEVRADLANGDLDRLFFSQVTPQREVLAAVALRWTGIGLIAFAGLMALAWRRRPASVRT